MTKIADMSREEAFKKWKKAVTMQGYFFVPHTGKCSCGWDFVLDYQKTGYKNPTGCRKCKRSFVD